MGALIEVNVAGEINVGCDLWCAISRMARQIWQNITSGEGGAFEFKPHAFKFENKVCCRFDRVSQKCDFLSIYSTKKRNLSSRSMNISLAASQIYWDLKNEA